MLPSILWSVAIGTVVAVPVLLLWGWVRWAKDHTPRSTSCTLALLGLCFATASAFLALTTHLYARFVRSFSSHDPTLLKIYLFGCAFSSLAILFSVGGSGRRGPLRSLAPVCAFATLLFWLIAMTSE
jgi:hypothetical protein